MTMKKWLKILIAIISVPIILIILFISYYLITNLQGEIEPYQVGNPDAEQKILIASQGSEFKEKLVTGLVSELKSDERYISIVDCTKLEDENLTTWDACVVIHTTQIHGMPIAAETFLEVSSDLSKVVLVSTSGGGDEKVKNFDVDAISSASRLIATPQIVKSVSEKLERILDHKNKLLHGSL